MRDQYNRCSVLIDLLEQLNNLVRMNGIEIPRWLIGDENLWSMDKGTSNRYALLLTTGKLPRISMSFVVESYDFEHLWDNLTNTSALLACYLQGKGDIFVNGFLRQ